MKFWCVFFWIILSNYFIISTLVFIYCIFILVLCNDKFFLFFSIFSFTFLSLLLLDKGLNKGENIYLYFYIFF